MLIVYLKKNINIFTNDYDDFVRGWFLKDLIKKNTKRWFVFLRSQLKYYKIPQMKKSGIPRESNLL